ncbi:MAG: hypothetical protein ABIE22_01630 [archaeon]
MEDPAVKSLSFSELMPGVDYMDCQTALSLMNGSKVTFRDDEATKELFDPRAESYAGKVVQVMGNPIDTGSHGVVIPVRNGKVTSTVNAYWFKP